MRCGSLHLTARRLDDRPHPGRDPPEMLRDRDHVTILDPGGGSRASKRPTTSTLVLGKGQKLGSGEASTAFEARGWNENVRFRTFTAQRIDARLVRSEGERDRRDGLERICLVS